METLHHSQCLIVEPFVHSKADKRCRRRLQSFHRRCARFITGRHIRLGADGEWIYPNIMETLEQAGLLPMDELIRRRAQTVLKFVQERPIYKRCLESRALASTQTVWWVQHKIAN